MLTVFTVLRYFSSKQESSEKSIRSREPNVEEDEDRDEDEDEDEEAEAEIDIEEGDGEEDEEDFASYSEDYNRQIVFSRSLSYKIFC